MSCVYPFGDIEVSYRVLMKVRVATLKIPHSIQIESTFQCNRSEGQYVLAQVSGRGENDIGEVQIGSRRDV